MSNVLLVIHLLVAAALVGVILLQRSEGGALGMGGGPGGIMSGRGAATALTRLTTGLGAAFFVLSVLLTVVGTIERRERGLLDRIDEEAVPVPAAAGAPALSPEELIKRALEGAAAEPKPEGDKSEGEGEPKPADTPDAPKR